MANLRGEYLNRHLGDPAFAAAHFAKDLNRDDPETFKVGYTETNAILATLEIFPEAREKSIRKLNGWELIV